MEDSPRKVIARDDWEKMLNAVHIRKQDMNKLVMNFLVHEGYDKAARDFFEESGTQPDINVETMPTRAAVKWAILSRKLEEAYKILLSSYPQVFEHNTLPLFHVQQQRYIELIRNGMDEEALEFGQEYLLPCVETNPELQKEVERSSALLAFKDPSNYPVGELLGRSHLLETVNEVNVAILAFEGHNEKDPKLVDLLKKLIWVQEELHKKAAYPHINLSSGILEDPVI
ncbi:hypothetical protein L1049_000796 [Liquidambar formosana]|uniref:CTLH domain-containing protein n=1 Tax=Liquidambar formosana TaxID=63359 RepID=A0AAP0N9F1_LIQFO